MPPQEILDYLGNPFAQSEPLEVPLAGSIYAIVYTYTNADDALWMDLPEIQLIQDNLINHDGETFELGDMTAGDEIRFFLNSSNTIVSGSNLYPHSEVVEEPTPGGDIHLWTLYFEDWTDLLFDEVEVEIYIRPEEPYPGNIAAIVEPEELAPGDTASITFKKRYLNGTLEDFPEWKTFEVGMVEGCDLGNLLVDGELAPYFYDVMQPVYFVADSSADTGTVKLQVALVEEIIGLRPVQNNITNETDKQIENENPEQKGNLKEVISARRESRTKPVNENKKIYENVTPNNPENVICPIEEIMNSSPFEISLKDESIEIMLGETKYFQAKFNEAEQKLEIVEVEDQLSGVTQNDGPVDGEEGWEWVTEDFWGTDPVAPVIEVGLSAVYWEKRYPVYIDNPGGNNHRDYVRSEALEDGLIRVVGRFWKEKEAGENESEYKNKHSVELTATLSNDVTKTIILKVIRPSSLGTTHNQEKDVFGNFYNLDEEIFYYAGKYGIPPQFIKADIEAEGNFNPAYRYEPFYTIKKLYKVNENGKFGLVHDLLISSSYRITVDGKIYLDASNINGTTNIGPVDGLEDHIYITNGTITNGTPVTIDGYPGYTGSIWDDFYANCKTINPDAAYDIYPKSYPQWSQDAIDGWQEKYDEFYSNWEKKIGTTITIGGVIIEITEELVKLGARLYANEWLKTEYRGGIFQKGIAQTRLAASYGLMQPIFPTANAYWQYNDKPEFLNENDINFSNAIPYLKLNVSKNQGTTLDEIDKKNNFSLGLEESYIFIFNNYHGSHKKKYGPNKNIYYGQNVINKNKKYDPIK